MNLSKGANFGFRSHFGCRRTPVWVVRLLTQLPATRQAIDNRGKIVFLSDHRASLTLRSISSNLPHHFVECRIITFG
jgi:hypothetical protein